MQTLDYFWRDAVLGVGVLISLLAAGAVVAVRTRRGDSATRAALLAVTAASIAAILVLTLMRYGVPTSFAPSAGLQWDGAGLSRFVADLSTSDEIAANIALFVPTAMLLTLTIRRPIVCAAALLATSVLIEFVQGVFGIGTPDPSDVLANATGTCIGVLAAHTAIAMHARRRWARVRYGLGVACALLAAVGLNHAAAFARQRSTESDVRARFAHMSLKRFETLNSNPGISEKLLVLGHLASDGDTVTGSEAVVRFPTSVLLVRQCVYVTFTPTGTYVRGTHGPDCTRLLV